jgi:uncharacterized membrane protein YhaH (DUF805 family)
MKYRSLIVHKNGGPEVLEVAENELWPGQRITWLRNFVRLVSVGNQTIHQGLLHQTGCLTIAGGYAILFEDHPAKRSTSFYAEEIMENMTTNSPASHSHSRRMTLLISSLVAGALFLYPLQMPGVIFYTLGHFSEIFYYMSKGRAIFETFTFLLLLCIPLAVIAGLVSYWKGGMWFKVTWIAALIGAGTMLLQQFLMASSGMAPWQYYSFLTMFFILLILAALVVMIATAVNLGKEPNVMMGTPSASVPGVAPAAAPAGGQGAIPEVLAAVPPQAPAPAAPKAGFFRMLFSDRGRINRGQYWGYSILVAVLYFVVAAGCAAILFSDRDNFMNLFPLALIVLLIASLLLMWSALALIIKRYHDLNKSAWWLLIVFIPVIGSLWQFIETCFVAGTPGPNRYGPPTLMGVHSQRR